nr:hypothetical protein [Synechococcus sp. CBW1108]
MLSSPRLIQCTSPRNTRRWRDHHHFQMLHLWVLLKKPTALRRQAALEALIWVHLHFQQHHRKLRAAGFGAARGLARPQNTIEAQRVGGGR